MTATGNASVTDRDARIARLLSKIAAAEVDQLLVTAPLNVRYVSGFTGSHIQPNGACLIGPTTQLLAAEEGLFRFERQPEVEAEGFDVLLGADPVSLLLPHTDQTVGFDESHVTMSELARWRALAPEIAFIPSGGLIETLRAVKDDSELQALRAASQLSDTVLEWLVEQGAGGRTEREVSLAMDRKMSELGAQGRAFDTRVLTAERAAEPHGMPDAIAISPNQLVLIDFGCVLDGYCSDCTRMFATGSIDASMQQAVDLVSEAQLAGLAAARAGMRGSDLDGVARQMLASAGFGDAFGHGLGHGVGLEVHESPTLTPRSQDTLVSRNIVSIEPGLYFPGSFGVRIEDLVVITDDGAERLTHFPKELLQL
jgi:Xaa-Pro aminopeptidase